MLVLSWLVFGAEVATVPDEWIDKDTGHRVIRLSRREGKSNCFYFHQNPSTAEGDKMVFIGFTQNVRTAFTVDLGTLEVRQITFKKNVKHEIVAPKRRELFYLSGDTIYSTHLDTLETREIAKVPAHYKHGRGLSVNAGETLLLGCYAKGEEEFYKTMPRDEWSEKIFEAKLPNALYTIEIETSKVAEFHHENAWLGHPQFSPKDPTLVEFCHEGPEKRLDRMWLIRTDGTELRKVYERTVPREHVTHEFWHPDGEHIWFDLQQPRFLINGRILTFLPYISPPKAYLGCTDITTGKTIRYKLDLRYYSWHYNISADGKLLCGDGEGRYFDPTHRGKWIYLFRPDGEKMQVERLCSMAKHSYKIAPNVHFTPDGKWVVFQSDMHGVPQVYAVEVNGAKGQEGKGVKGQED